MAKPLSYSINHQCQNPTTLNYKTPIMSVYAPDNATPELGFVSEEIVFTKEKFKTMFKQTSDYFKGVYKDYHEPNNLPTIRFLNYIIYKYEGKTLVYITYSDDNDPGKSALHKTEPIISINSDLEKLYIQYLKFLIYHSSLEEFIERELSAYNEVNYIRVSVDLYLNRSIIDPVFHKDSYIKNHVHYVTLSYYSEQETTGPELIGWSKEFEDIGEKSLVIRPLIPIMGTVGFNDWLFLHSSLINIIDLTNIINQITFIQDSGAISQGLNMFSIRGSAHPRAHVISEASRDFLRTWWHLEPKVLNNKRPLTEDGVYELFGTIQKINDKKYDKTSMEVEGEELPPYSPDFQDYVNKVKENGSERIEYNIASVARGFDTGDIDGRTADIIRLFNALLPTLVDKCSIDHHMRYTFVGGITKKRRKSKNKRSSNKKIIKDQKKDQIIKNQIIKNQIIKK